MSALPDCATLRVARDGRVVTVTVDHPPVNLMDGAMMKDLARLGRALAADEDARVVVVESANPEFFIAHADVERLLSYPLDPDRPADELNGLHRVFETWRTLPQATIAKIAGRARGGGSELALSLDLRFAARETALLSQPEVGLGIPPGGGGTQRLARLLGRGRALEVVLSGRDVDADLAERYGYVNRALPAAELDAFVADLARRIASHPRHAIVAAKGAVDAALGDPRAGLLSETEQWETAFVEPETRRRMEAFMALDGTQTPAVERDWEPIFDALAEDDGAA